MKGHHATARRTIAAAALGVLGAIGGALAGCNFVVDAGSYHVGLFSDGGSTGGDSGGAGQEGGSSTTGDGGTGGADGGGRGNGDGGQEGGSGGVTPTCTGPCGCMALPTTAAYQQLVNACIIAASCDTDLFPVNISTCVTDNYLAAYPSLRCLESITSCDDFYSCEGSAIATPDQCTDTSSESDEGTCGSAGVALSCYYSEIGPFNTIENCAVLGGTCESYTDSNDAPNTAAGCYLGACSDATDNSLHCMGTAQIYTCVNGSAYGQTCPPSSICGTLGGSTSCYYQSSACTSVGSSCNGGVLSVCSATPVNSGNAEQVVNYDCTTAGLQCQTDDAGSGQCVSPGCQTSSTCTEGCDSTTGVITYCVGGVAATFDCAQNGFTSCGCADPSSTTGDCTDASPGDTLFTYCTY